MWDLHHTSHVETYQLVHKTIYYGWSDSGWSDKSNKHSLGQTQNDSILYYEV